MYGRDSEYEEEQSEKKNNNRVQWISGTMDTEN